MSQIGIIQLTSFNSDEVNMVTDAIYSLSRNCKVIRDFSETVSFIYYRSMVDFDIEKFCNGKADLLGYLAKGKEIKAIRVLILNDSEIEDDCQTEFWTFKESEEGTLAYCSVLVDFNLYTYLEGNMSRIQELLKESDRVPYSDRLCNSTSELDGYYELGEYLYQERLMGTDLSFINPLYLLNKMLELSFLFITDIFDVLLDDMSKLIRCERI